MNERTQYMTENSIHQRPYILKNEICTQNEPLLENKLIKSYNNIEIKYITFGVGMKHNHCIFKDNSKIGVAKIVKIIQCIISGNVFVIIKEYKSFNNYFSSPCSSKLFYCGFVGNLSDEEKLIPIESIVTKCIHYQTLVISLI